ncbi:MAG: caspase family protein [Prevotella sp.]|nr:caspase family protein [Prevotella sp.]
MGIRKLLMTVMLINVSASMVLAQTAQNIEKEAEKAAKKEVKRLEKEGWKVAPGGIPMEMQLKKNYIYSLQDDKYVVGDAISGGSFYDAAKSTARPVAMMNMAEKAAVDFDLAIDAMLSNRQISKSAANSASEIVKKASSSVSQRLGRLITLLDIYRTNKDGLVEVRMVLACDREQFEQAKKDVYVYDNPNPLISASLYIGDSYYNAEGEEENIEQALAWYEKAANQGSTEAKEKIRMIKDLAAMIVWQNKDDMVNTAEYQVKVGIKANSKVKDVDVSVNGKKYREFRGMNVVKDDCYDMVIDKMVTLAPGGNNIKVSVRTSDGKKSFTTKHVVYNPEDIDDIYYRRIALIVGNSNYQGMGNSLPNPKNDAMDLAAKLRTLGFFVIEETDLDKNTFEEKLQEFGKKAKGYDVALFYYAGHGIQSKGVNYLMPVDAAPKSEASVPYNCVNANWVIDELEGTKARIIILDACRNNPFERGWHRGTTEMNWAQMKSPSGTYIAYATSAGNVAHDGEGRNSPYASAMLRTLDRPNLSLEAFFKEVRTLVRQSTGEEQIGQDSSSFIGEFIFNKK